jgi:hypothetical protein
VGEMKKIIPWRRWWIFKIFRLGYPKYEIFDGKMVLKQQSWRLGTRFSEKPVGFFFGERNCNR